MRSYGKTMLKLEISNLVALLIKYSKHAKHLSEQNKKLRIEKLELKRQIEELRCDVEDLKYYHRYKPDDYYDEDDIGYN